MAAASRFGSMLQTGEHHGLGTLMFIYCINRRAGGGSHAIRDTRTPSMMPGDEALAASGLVFTPGAHTSLGVFQPRGDILLQIRCTWIYGIRLGETSTYFSGLSPQFVFNRPSTRRPCPTLRPSSS